LIGAVLPVASRKRVIVRCTGGATSTFGGGGGTKLFCSQALNATNAVMAKATRQALAARARAAPWSLLHAGKRVGFISVPQSICSGKAC
jgi:hypothetical protein